MPKSSASKLVNRLNQLVSSLQECTLSCLNSCNENSHPIVGPFEIIKVLGEGTFSSVKLAKNKKTGELAALKMIPLSIILATEKGRWVYNPLIRRQPTIDTM